jgi:hypothetical protein
MTRIGRRNFGSLLGGMLASLTIARRTQGDASPPPRLILVMQNNGTQQANFWPTGSPLRGFTSPILEPLLSNPFIAARTTVVRGLEMQHDRFGTSGNDHDIGFNRLFCGAPLISVAGEPWGGGPSVDQVVARKWDTDSLALAVLASQFEPYPKPGFANRRSFSYIAPGVQKIPTLNPFDAYARFFATTSTSAEAAAQLARRKSALDVAAGDLRELRARASSAARDKLDAHETSIRQLEGSLQTLMKMPQCTPPQIPFDYRARPELLVSSDEAIPALVDAMVDVLATTMGCGLARVATLQLGYGGGKWMFGWEGINMNMHDDLAHKDTSDQGSSPDVTAKLVTINRWYASVVARLAGALAATPESDGSTALDHTLIVWGNELARGDHSLTNLPVVLVGGKLADATKRGKLVDVGPQPFQRLGCTILRSMGMPADGFGDTPTCGPILGL